MIDVTVSDGKITATGHSGYAPPGQDIVCAGVSVLVQNLVNSIEELTEDKISYDIKPGMADIYIGGNPSEKTKTLIDSFFIGCAAIADAYPEHVKIS
jgi:uncharacterized protein YsxB (DUF464 family)